MCFSKKTNGLIDIKEAVFCDEYKHFITQIQLSNNPSTRVKHFKDLFKNKFSRYKEDNLIDQIYIFYWDVIKNEWVGRSHPVFDSVQENNSSNITIDTHQQIEKDFGISFRHFVCTSSIHNRPPSLLRSVSENNYLEEVNNNEEFDYPVVLIPCLDELKQGSDIELMQWLEGLKQEKSNIWEAFSKQMNGALSKYYDDALKELESGYISNNLSKMDVLLFYLILIPHINSFNAIHYFPTNILKGTSGGISIFSSNYVFTNDEFQRVSRFVHDAFTAVYITDMEAAWLKNATKAALSAIINRNHSHHIHSHITPRTSVEHIKNKLRKRLPSLSSSSALDIINILKTRLDRYIQEKSDFFAEVSTEPVITTKTVPFLTGIIYPFVSNSLIMDNLCANEGIGWPENENINSKIRIISRFNGQKLDANFKCPSNCSIMSTLSNYPYSATCSCCTNNKELQFNGITGNDFEVAVPGPLGEYAVYCLLENVIRNAAKHNRDGLESMEFLGVYIEVSEADEEFYKVEVWDNVTDPLQEISLKTEGGEKVIPLIEFLNHRVQQPIINKDGSIKKSALGVAEIKIMATLLKGSDNFIKMQENLKIKKCRKGKNGKESLVYTFNMMRPKKVAIIDTLQTDDEIGAGVWGFTSYKKYKNHSQHGRSIATFEFVVIGESLSSEHKRLTSDEYNDLLRLLPFRVLIYDSAISIPGAKQINNNLIEDLRLKKISAEEAYKKIWHIWNKRLLEDIGISDNFSLVIYLQQNHGDPPTSEWKEHSHSHLNVIADNICNEDIRVIPEGNQLMVFDRHFGVYRTYKELNNGLRKYIIFHEIIEKNSSDFIHIFSPPTSRTADKMTAIPARMLYP